MIPKIIHLCWLSGDAFPKDIVVCLESWKQHLSDYEVWLWGKKPNDSLGLKIVEKHFDLDSVLWCKQAFDAKKYAFAADYIRLYALYNYGGIYMDSDVVVYKSFNDLLHLPYFIGEDKTHCFEPAIIGCEPGLPWVGQVLKRYEGRQFAKEDGSYDMRGLPLVFYDQLVGMFEFEKIKMPANYVFKSGVLNIFSSEYFNSRDYIGAIKTEDSYCSHNYLGSWMNNATTTGAVVNRFLPRWFVNILFKSYYTLNASKLVGVKIPYKK